MLGATGTGAGVINSISSEVLQNKLANTGHLLHQLDRPVEENFKLAAQITVSMTSLIQWMQHIEPQNSHTLAEAIIALERNTSFALMSTQAQTWYLTVIKGIILQGMEGHIPLEVKSLLIAHTKQSPQFQPYNQMLQFSFDLNSWTITVIISGIIGGQEDKIFPILTLGIRISNTFVIPQTRMRWARE